MKPNVTIGEKYGPAMQITDQAEADCFFGKLVAQWLLDNPQATRAEAERAERANIGYYAGYCSDATRGRVEKLFKAEHPIFGHSRPTAREAYAAGIVAAEQGIEAARGLFPRHGGLNE
jgi:hypothetical protein